MTTSRAQRREARRPRAVATFGEDADAALDLLELLELAWHDCFGTAEVPEAVLDDVWLLADDLPRLASAARLAVTDTRDLRMAADARR